MPQVIFLALVGAGLYAGYRWIARTSNEVAAELKRTDEQLRQRAAGGAIEKNMGALEYDPASGVYKPAERG